jgi:hypothetical protein
MSYTTTNNKSVLNTMTVYKSRFQQNNVLSREYFCTLRQYFFRTVGLSLVIYGVIPLPLIIWNSMKFIGHLLVRLIGIGWSMFMRSLSIFIFNGNNTHVSILLCIINGLLSLSIVQYTQKTIEAYSQRYIRQHDRSSDRQRLVSTCVYLAIWISLMFVLQTFVWLMPIVPYGRETSHDMTSTSSSVRKQTNIDNDEQCTYLSYYRL